MCGKKGASDDQSFKSWKLNVNRILDKNKSEEAGWCGKVCFSCVKLQLVRHANGNVQQIQDSNSREPH